jgi:hypothetical protein
MTTIFHKNLVFWEHRILCGQIEAHDRAQYHSNGVTGGLKLTLFVYLSLRSVCVVSYPEWAVASAGALCYYFGNFQTRHIFNGINSQPQIWAAESKYCFN